MIQPFLVALHLTVPQIAIFSAIVGFGSMFGGAGLLTIVGQAAGGALADRIGPKRMLMIGESLLLAAYLLLAASARRYDTLPFLLGSFCFGISSISRPARKAEISNSVSNKFQGTGHSMAAFGVVLGSSVAALSSGLLAQSVSYSAPFFIAGLVCAVSIIIVPKLPEASTTDQTGRGNAGSTFFSSITKRHYYLITIMAADAFFWGCGWTLFFSLLDKTYHVGPLRIGTMLAVMYFFWAACQLFVGPYIDRFGPALVALISQAISIPFFLYFSIKYSYSLALGFIALMGVSIASWQPAIDAWLGLEFQSTMRGRAYGMLAASRDLVGAFGPLLGGFFYSKYGIWLPMIVNLVGCLFIITLLALAIHLASRYKKAGYTSEMQ